MNFPFFIAKRYLVSRKSTNAINIISGISVTVFTIGTAVMIIILSFLNGLEGLVKDLNNSFDPDLQITSTNLKYFEPDLIISKLEKIDGIAIISKSIEDNVVVRYGDAQEIARVKGVDSFFKDLNDLDTLIISGRYQVNNENGKTWAVFGGAIASSLNIQPSNLQKTATLFIPTKGVEYNHLNPEASLNSVYVLPSGIIMLTDDTDKDMILVSMETAQALFQTKNKVSALEIGSETVDVSDLQEKIIEALGSDFVVRNRNQQNEEAYKVFTTEKWATFAILTLVLLIAAFNTIGALTMLVLEKKKDISILQSMGASGRTIRKIFLLEGMLITVVGILFGLIIGIAFVWLQQEFGLVELEGSFVEFFPIKIKWMDLVLIVGVIISFGFIASIYPAWQAVQSNMAGRQSE